MLCHEGYVRKIIDIVIKIQYYIFQRDINNYIEEASHEKRI